MIAEKMGFNIVGILPAIDIDSVSHGTQKRVYEAVYAKILAPDHEIAIPSPEMMTDKTKRLFEILFS